MPFYVVAVVAVVVVVIIVVIVVVIVVVVVVVIVVVVVVTCRLRGKYNWGIKLSCLNAGGSIQPLLQTGILTGGFRGLGTSSAHDPPTVSPGGRRGMTSYSTHSLF